MPKRSKEQIEKDEIKILKELEKNASESINKIAKKCGFSRQKVWRIIKRLEKNNTIWGYVTIVDGQKQNIKDYTVLIKRTNKPSDKYLLDSITERKIEKEAKKIDIKVDSSFYTNGIFDWVICFTARDIKHAKKFCEALNTIYKGYIQETHLLEKMFPIKRCGIANPEIKKLKEYTTL